jgi:hypothetical protein
MHPLDYGPFTEPDAGSMMPALSVEGCSLRGFLPLDFMRLDGQGVESMAEIEYQPHPALK